MAEAGKERVGAGDVGSDLRAQLFGAAKLFLFAKALPKPNFHPCRYRGEIRIEQMRFNAERRAVKRRAHADIRNRAATASLPFEARARDVDAPCRKGFLLRRQLH